MPKNLSETLNFCINDNPFSDTMQETSLLQRVKSPQYTEPLSIYQKKLKCQTWKCKHEEVCRVVLIFRSRWSQLNKSLEAFWPSDFQVKLTIETCSGLRDFQPERNTTDLILYGFRFSRSCLFPLNNAYVGHDDVANGTKFVVSREEETQKLKHFFQEYDYLFFAQNLDLLTKTCSGGLLFFTGHTVVGVILKDAYSFIMDGSTMESFLEEYIWFSGHKQCSESLMYKQFLGTINLTDGRLHRRGARENKFGLLRSEIFRETRKQVKKIDLGSSHFSEKVYQVVIRIDLNFVAGERTCQLKWVCQCLGDLALGQVLRWYRANWGAGIEADQFKFFYSKPHFGSVNLTTLVGTCQQTNPVKTEGCPEINIVAEPLRGGFLTNYSCSVPEVVMQEKFVLGRATVRMVQIQGTRDKEYKLVVPIDQIFADLIEAIDSGLNLETLKIFFNKSQHSNHLVHVPLSMSLRNLAYIYGKPKDEIFRLFLAEAANEVWMQANTMDVLEQPSGRTLVDRMGCGDQHFKNCDKKHALLWHGRLITEFLHPSYLNLMLYSCGSENISVFNEKAIQLLGLQINDVHKMRIVQEFFINCYNLVPVLAPKVDKIRQHDAAQNLRQMICSSTFLLLVAKMEDKWVYGLLVDQTPHMIVIIPKKQTNFGSMLSEDADLLRRIDCLSLSGCKLPVLETMPITCLDTIRPLYFKFTPGVPLGKPTAEGIEGLMLITIPVVIKKVKVNQLLNFSFVEVYSRPPLLSQVTVDAIISEDRRFLIDFDDVNVLQHIYPDTSTIAVATSYVVETDKRDVSNHIFFVMRYTRDQKRIEGFLPQKAIQARILQKMLNTTPWLKEALGTGKTTNSDSKKNSTVSEKPKVVGQKDRILLMLQQALLEPQERFQPPASNFSWCPNCGKFEEKALVCCLCYKARYCNSECYKKGRTKHEVECYKIQGRRNGVLITQIDTPARQKTTKNKP